MNNAYIIDVEASGPIPGHGIMTEAGIVHFETGDSFYIRTHNFHPDPEILPSFCPVVDLRDDGTPDVNLGYKIALGTEDAEQACSMDGFIAVPAAVDVTAALRDFISEHTPGYPQPISDNPSFDMPFINEFLINGDAQGLFGHSGRRIGDFYAGVTGEWKNANRWKKYRKTAHTHHPVADARGNAEALAHILTLVK